MKISTSSLRLIIYLLYNYPQPHTSFSNRVPDETGVSRTNNSKHKNNKLRYHFPRLLLTNAESLNFEELIEL